jgi:hypothetical protein
VGQSGHAAERAVRERELEAQILRKEHEEKNLIGSPAGPAEALQARDPRRLRQSLRFEQALQLVRPAVSSERSLDA